MTIAWITYGLLVGGLLTATAYGLEGVCRIAGRPARWVWAGALTLMVVLVGTAPHRAASLSGSAAAAEVAPTGTAPASGSWSASLRAIRHVIVRPTQAVLVRAEQHIPAIFNPYLAAVWLSLSALVMVLLSAVYLHFRHRRRRWPVTELHGVRVRIAPDAGPAVIGLNHPEIVIPRWLLARSPEEQRLVLAHEGEHVRARDPLLLTGACIAAALLPWHPAVWWMLSRLRLAVELDCDMRVLRQGVAPRLYGALLIDLAGRYSGAPMGAPALADKSSHLKQRILAIQVPRPRFALARESILGTCALLYVIAAYESKIPSSDRSETSTASSKSEVRFLVFDEIFDNTKAIVLIDGVRTNQTVRAALDSLAFLNDISGLDDARHPSDARRYGVYGDTGVIAFRTRQGQLKNRASATD